MWRMGLLAISSLLAQNVLLQGQVKDPEDKPLSHVIVKLAETGFQIVTSGGGHFTLSFSTKQRVILEFRHLGYRIRRDTLFLEDTILKTFVLYPQEVRLPSVVITEGNTNPAEVIIRKAIAVKDKNRSCLPAFRAETYTLFTLRWGEGTSRLLRRLLQKEYHKGEVVFMSEALSYLYFAPPDKYKEEIVRSRIVGQRSYSFLGSWIFQGFDPYGERLSLPDLTETPLILPLAQDAFLYYRYKLMGSYWDDNGFFYKIAIEPRSASSPCVEGYLVLADESFALVGLEWYVKSPRPIRYTDSLGVRITYVPVGQCYQVGELSFRGIFRISLPVGEISIEGEGYGAYKRYQLLIPKEQKKPKILPPHSPSLSYALPTSPPIETLRVEKLDFGEKVRVLTDAAEPRGAFWDSIRWAPLDSAQIAYLNKQDSVISHPDTAPSRWSGGFNILTNGIIRWHTRHTTERRTKDFSFDFGWIFYNKLEGWGLPLRISYENLQGNQEKEFWIYLRYGTGWKRLAPMVGWRHKIRTFPLWEWSFKGGIEVREPTDLPQVPLLWNTVYYLLQGVAPWQGYLRPFVQGEVERYLHRTLRIKAWGGWDIRPFSAENKSFYEAWRLATLFAWEPGTQSFTTPRRTLLLPPEKVFRWRISGAVELAKIPRNLILSTTSELTTILSIS
ncbi:MAG: DUF5686 family protein, partial [Bacteroidia bacterium]|nr:DUF5686 family protein [Bacteroidia bacterium]